MKALKNGLRWFFCILFMASAIGKLLDNRGFAEVISTYQFGIPQDILLPLALAVSLTELLFALLLAGGLRMIACSVFAVVSHIGYTLLAITTLARGISIENCGCFGVFLARPLTTQTVIEDLVLLILSFLFLFCVKKSPKPRSALQEHST